VITGGSGGLGVAVVRELASLGADCRVPLAPGENASALDGLPGNIALSPNVDLRDELMTRSFYESLPPLWASIHLAGGFAMAPLAETSVELVERMFRLNVVTAFLCCREAVARMGSAGGRIVNVAARPALAPIGGMSAYVVSKAAVAALTQSLADELREVGIAVNAVVPSIVDTPANRRAMPDADHSRWPTPAQLAKTISFLVSDGAGITSGALVPVYGRA